MEGQVPGCQSPLYGRRTARFLIIPGALHLLLEPSTLFPQMAKQFHLFSKSGFTKVCEKEAAGKARLVSFAEMAGG
jgi:hypothetical protein